MFICSQVGDVWSKRTEFLPLVPCSDWQSFSILKSTTLMKTGGAIGSLPIREQMTKRTLTGPCLHSVRRESEGKVATLATTSMSSAARTNRESSSRQSKDWTSTNLTSGRHSSVSSGWRMRKRRWSSRPAHSTNATSFWWWKIRLAERRRNYSTRRNLIGRPRSQRCSYRNSLSDFTT